MLRLEGIRGLQDHAGRHLGESDWVSVDQSTIDAFGVVTHDRHWIHLDPARAAASPLGTTIAHGFYSLALIGGLMQTIFQVDGVREMLAYGLDRVRFPTPVPVGSRLRLALELTSVELPPAGNEARALFGCRVEGEGLAKPACVAELQMRYYA